MIVETSKEERKMFIFANTFELLHLHLVHKLTAFEMYPIFQCLELTVGHLSRSIFDMQRSSIDEYIMTLLLRHQLRAILEFDTTSKLFGTVFGERISLKTQKHSIFEDTFNPQAAASLAKIYTTILMISKQAPQTCQKIILSLAFNEPILLKMLRFIETYCEVDKLVGVNARTTDHYHQHIHSLTLFMLAFKHNLWVSNLDEFVKSQYFDKADILNLIRVCKPLIANLLKEAAELEQKKQQLALIDEFVLMSAS
jgi:hypothetical protein